MKKVLILITSALAVCTAFSAGCTNGNNKTEKDDDKPYGLIQEDTPKQNDNENLTEEIKNAPHELLVRPREPHKYNGGTPRLINADDENNPLQPDDHMPHKRHGHGRRPRPKPMLSDPR